MLIGNLDGDRASELIILDNNRIIVAGLKSSKQEYEERFILEQDSVSSRLDRMAEALFELSYAIAEKREASVVESKARRAALILSDDGRLEYAADILETWFDDTFSNGGHEAILRLLADLFLLDGNYTKAENFYRRCRDPSRVDLPPGLPNIPCFAPELSGRLVKMKARSQEESSLKEGFDGNLPEWDVALTGHQNGLIKMEDSIGQFGGRGDRGTFAKLFVKSNWEATDLGEQKVSRILRSRQPVWSGTNPIRVRFHVYFEKMSYDTSFFLRLVRTDKKEDVFAKVRFEHCRNSMELEGDRYLVTRFSVGQGEPLSPTGLFTAEFPIGQWISVELDHVPSLSFSHLELRYVDRRNNDPLITRIHVENTSTGKPGDYYLELEGSVNLSEDPEREEQLSVFLDEISFSF